MTIKERVDNGVALLDDYLPEWRKFINTERLDLSLPSRCILGQLELWKVPSSSKECTKHGFLHTDRAWSEDGFIFTSGFDSVDDEYSQLTEEWLTRL